VTPDGYHEYLAEIIAGVGIVPDRTPGWARGGRTGKVAYEIGTRALARSGIARRVAQGLRYLPPPMRNGLVNAKRRLLG
jgi:hypothetical protein